MPTLADEFSARGPWITSFDLEGDRLGGAYDAKADRRIAEFQRRFPHPGRVLELGCLEGGHTVSIARFATEVVAVDCRTENIEKARFIQRTYRAQNVQFLVADLDRWDVGPLGIFDVAFNVGLLYHLTQPWRLLDDLAKSCRAMFLWTHFARRSWWMRRRGGYVGRLYREGGTQDPLSGMSPESFWPTKRELLRMLEDVGFSRIEIIDIDADHPHGPAILLTCRSTAVTGPSDASLLGVGSE